MSSRISHCGIESETSKGLFLPRNDQRLANKRRKMAAELFLLDKIDSDAYDAFYQGPSGGAQSAITTVITSQYTRDRRNRNKQKPRLEFEQRDFSRPVNLGDFRNFFLNACLRDDCPFKPKFGRVKNPRSLAQTTLVLVDCTASETLSGQSPNGEYDFFTGMPFIRDNFLHRFHIEYDDDADFHANLFRIPLNMVCRNDASPEETSKNVSKKDFLLTLSEMYEFNFTLPDWCPDNGNTTSIDVFKPSKASGYGRISESSPIFAMDCEMCMTRRDKHELTRISVLDEDLNVVLDTLVKPDNKIVDYVTRFSGITKEMLSHTKTTLHDVQKILDEILPPDAILCGHSLHNDLNALHLFHPYVMDISRLFNISGDQCHVTSLKNLTWRFLGETIQSSKLGHCSVQDSYATMKLARLKLNAGVQFGNALFGWDADSLEKKNLAHCQSNGNSSSSSHSSNRKTLHSQSSHSSSSDDPQAKKPRLSTEPIFPTVRPSVMQTMLHLKCSNCQRPIENFNCRNNSCVCRTLSRRFCRHCGSSQKIDKSNLDDLHRKSVHGLSLEECQASHVNQCESSDCVQNAEKSLTNRKHEIEQFTTTRENPVSKLEQCKDEDSGELLPLSEVLNLTRHPHESIFRLFERKDKKVLWVSLNCNGVNKERIEICELADGSKNCKRKNSDSNRSTLHAFCGEKFGSDLNILELKSDSDSEFRSIRRPETKMKKKYRNFDEAYHGGIYANFTDEDFDQWESAQQCSEFSAQNSSKGVDNLVQEILMHSAKDSLVCLVFKTEKWAVCCVKVNSQ